MSSDSLNFWSTSLFTLVACSILLNAAAWDLAQLGLNETYRVEHLSTHFTRVFLCISVESDSFPTLVESQWPASYRPIPSAIFPNPEAHIQMTSNSPIQKGEEYQTKVMVRDCSRLQKVIWTQVDSLSRLYVLDIGWVNEAKSKGAVDNNNIATTKDYSCPPKLIAYDLLRNNVEVLRIDCSEYIPKNASQVLAVKLGPRATPCQIEKYVYFLLANDPHILAYDIVEQKWQRRLLVSKKYATIDNEKFPIHPIDIAFNGRDGQEMLISDTDGILYSSTNLLLQSNDDKNIEKPLFDDNTQAFGQCNYQSNSAHQPFQNSTNSIIDNFGNFADEIDSSNVLEMRVLGSLLGPSRGLMIDYSNIMFYIVPKFGAIVRCPYKDKLTTEDNEIIYLTSKNVKQIFFGSQDSLWLLTDRRLAPDDNCFAGLH